MLRTFPTNLGTPRLCSHGIIDQNEGDGEWEQGEQFALSGVQSVTHGKRHLSISCRVAGFREEKAIP
jgi:hypothetical protein